MSACGRTRGPRSVAVSSIAMALLLAPFARPAPAQTCDAGIFATQVQEPGGASLRMTRSTPVYSPSTGWALQACFVLAQHGTATGPVMATVDLRLAGQPSQPFYQLAGPQLYPVGGVPAICQVQTDQLHLSLASVAPLPPLAISQECCVYARHPTTATCELLPREPDVLHAEIVTTPPQYVADVVVGDRSRGRVASGKIAFCGLTGIELLGVPFALLALRARSGRRAGGAS